MPRNWQPAVVWRGKTRRQSGRSVASVPRHGPTAASGAVLIAVEQLQRSITTASTGLLARDVTTHLPRFMTAHWWALAVLKVLSTRRDAEQSEQTSKQTKTAKNRGGSRWLGKWEAPRRLAQCAENKRRSRINPCCCVHTTLPQNSQLLQGKKQSSGRARTACMQVLAGKPHI